MGFRGSRHRSYLLSLLLTLTAPGLFADCPALLKEVHQAAARPHFKFSAEGSTLQMPSIEGKVVSSASSMGSAFLYLTSPGSRADYVVVKKGDHGFGFSRAQSYSYDILDSKELELLDLKVDGTQSFFLGLVASPSTPDALVAKVATVQDAETGRLEFSDIDPLLIETVDTKSAHLAITARPQHSEYWLTDGSESLRFIRLGEVGLELGLSVKVKDLLGLDPQGSEFVGFESVRFAPGGKVALVVARALSGARWMIPVEIDETANEKEELVSVTYKAITEKAFLLQPGESLAARPDRNLLLLFNEKQIRGVSFDSEKMEFHEVLSASATGVEGDGKMVGFDYHWDGVLIPKPNEKDKYQFVGELKAHAIVFDAQENKTRIVWLHWGRSR
jgi:hypothetical protein